MKLKTERLTIRFVGTDDWRAVLGIWADFEASPYARYDVPLAADEATAREKTRLWAEAAPLGRDMFFAVCLNGAVIGYADFHRTERGYEFGYCFHSAFHGRGYARESLSALLERLADGRKTTFTAGTALGNLPSVRLLDALGFERVGEEKVSFYKDESGADIFFDGGIFARTLNG